MTDRELLELAAKAADIEWFGIAGDEGNTVAYFDIGPVSVVKWNPLTDDGDALRLAVQLGISVWRDRDVIWCNGVASVAGDDPCAATRLAIVRAAAETVRTK